MRVISEQDVVVVSGGLTEATGMELIGGIIGVCGALSIAPAAVAFGAGVLLGDAIVNAASEL